MNGFGVSANGGGAWGRASAGGVALGVVPGGLRERPAPLDLGGFPVSPETQWDPGPQRSDGGSTTLQGRTLEWLQNAPSGGDGSKLGVSTRNLCYPTGVPTCAAFAGSANAWSPWFNYPSTGVARCCRAQICTQNCNCVGGPSTTPLQFTKYQCFWGSCQGGAGGGAFSPPSAQVAAFQTPIISQLCSR